MEYLVVATGFQPIKAALAPVQEHHHIDRVEDDIKLRVDATALWLPFEITLVSLEFPRHSSPFKHIPKGRDYGVIPMLIPTKVGAMGPHRPSLAIILLAHESGA